MKKISSLLLAALLIAGQVDAQEPRLRKIFNGKNLSGWKVSDGPDQWTVSKRTLHVRNNAAKKGSILWTDASYRDFIIQ